MRYTNALSLEFVACPFGEMLHVLTLTPMHALTLTFMHVLLLTPRHGLPIMYVFRPTLPNLNLLTSSGPNVYTLQITIALFNLFMQILS